MVVDVGSRRGAVQATLDSRRVKSIVLQGAGVGCWRSFGGREMEVVRGGGGG